MRKALLSALLVLCLSYAHAQDNPYAVFGYKPKTILKDEPEHLKVFNKDTSSMIRAFAYDAEAKSLIFYEKNGEVSKTLKVGTNEIYRFMSIDPRAEKYYETNPYHFTLNNPIRYIDPNGDTVRVAGNVEQQAQLNSLLSNLRTTKAGEALYQQLNGSANVFTINVTSGDENFAPTSRAYAGSNVGINGTPNQGSGGDISVNPDLNTASTVPTTKGPDVNPTTNLAHEMGHGADADRGKLDNTKSKNGLNYSEYSAVHVENQVRSQLPNTGLRTFYNIKGGISVPVLQNHSSAVFFPGIPKTGYNYLHPGTKR